MESAVTKGVSARAAGLDDVLVEEGEEMLGWVEDSAACLTAAAEMKSGLEAENLCVDVSQM